MKEKRMRRILEFVAEQGAVTAEQIRQEFFVSLPTIYRDLRELMRQNLLMEEGGRFRRTLEQTVTTPLDFRGSINIEQKKAIAAEAAKLIREHSVIFIDASTTANHIIDHLTKFEDLTILTNGLATAMHLKQAGLRTYCVGGELVENSLAVSGRLAKSMLEEFEIDVLLFSAHGVNGAGFIVDPSEKETNLRRYLLKRAACSVFLCDSGKFGRNSIFNIAPLRNVDYLVTNAGPHVLDAEVRRRIITV